MAPSLKEVTVESHLCSKAAGLQAGIASIRGAVGPGSGVRAAIIAESAEFEPAFAVVVVLVVVGAVTVCAGEAGFKYQTFQPLRARLTSL